MKRVLIFSCTALVLFCYDSIFSQTVAVNPCTGGNTMQDAIDEVVTNDAPNQTILIDASFFTNQSPGGNWGLSTLAGSSGNNLSGLTIDGQGSYIESNAAGLGFFDISNIDNLTIKNITFDGFNRSLGALNIDNCENLLLENVNFVNSPSTQPVVITAVNGNTSVSFVDCEINGNPTSSSAPSNGSNTGGVKITGNTSAPWHTISTSFTNCSFRCNGRDTDGGGAVQITTQNSTSRPRTDVSTTFTNCDFSNNTQTAVSGGGAAIYATGYQTINIFGSTFYNNVVSSSTSTSGAGGAINILTGVDLYIDNTYFVENATSGGSGAPDGGAIAGNSSSSTKRNNITLTNSVFAGNEAKDEGGALFLRHTNATVSNTLFVNNITNDGGTFHIENAGTFSLDSVTITGTTGTSGKGIENNLGSLSISNTIDALNGSNSTGLPTATNSTLAGTGSAPSPGFTSSTSNTNLATFDYNVVGSTQGVQVGVLDDVSSGTDCAAEKITVESETGSALSPCDPIPGLLPVELLYFSAKSIENCVNEIEWETATEVNNDFFKILKSYDGINFEEIARISGKGNTTQKSKYSYIDNEENQNQVYYQLAQVDYDGTLEYFNIIPHTNNCNKTSVIIDVKPNPFKDFIQIDILSIQEGFIYIKLQNIEGKLLFETSKIVATNQSNITFETSNIKEGIYFLKIFNNQNQIDIIKLIKL